MDPTVAETHVETARERAREELEAVREKRAAFEEFVERVRSVSPETSAAAAGFHVRAPSTPNKRLEAAALFGRCLFRPTPVTSLEITMHMGREEVRRRYDWSTVPPSVAVTESIAVFEYGEPRDVADVLQPPLGEHVETEALNALVTDAASVAVEFTAGDYLVRIDGDTVTVRSNPGRGATVKERDGEDGGT